MSIFADTLRRRLQARAEEKKQAILRGYSTFEEYRFAVAGYRELLAVLDEMTSVSKDLSIEEGEED